MPVFIGILRTHVHCQRYCGVSLTASSSHVKSHRRRFILRMRVAICIASVWTIVLKAFNSSSINDRNMTWQTPRGQSSLDQWGSGYGFLEHRLRVQFPASLSQCDQNLKSYSCLDRWGSIGFSPLLTNSTKSFRSRSVRVCMPLHCWQTLPNCSCLDRWGSIGFSPLLTNCTKSFLSRSVRVCWWSPLKVAIESGFSFPCLRVSRILNAHSTVLWLAFLVLIVFRHALDSVMNGWIGLIRSRYGNPVSAVNSRHEGNKNRINHNYNMHTYHAFTLLSRQQQSITYRNLFTY